MDPDAAAAAEAYYDSDDADTFYEQLWGGVDLHIGLHEGGRRPIREAGQATVEAMAARLAHRPAGTEVIDLGSGFGGVARYLAATHGWRVTCLNISERQNERNRRAVADDGLDDLVSVHHGSFEDIPFPDASFDVAWSQDAMLHAADKGRVVAEAARVLRPGGEWVFTDPMRTDDCPADVLGPIASRVAVDDLGSPSGYVAAAGAAGLEIVEFEEHLEDFRTTYDVVREELRRRRAEIDASADYVERMLTGLDHWVRGADDGHMVWGIWHLRKPA